MLRLLLLLSLLSFNLLSQTGDTVILNKGLYIKFNSGQNKVISPNEFTAAIVTGNLHSPEEGKPVVSGSRIKWQKIEADSNGWYYNDSLVNAYLYFNYYSEKDEVVLVEAMGNSMFYVNGTPRSGNPYRYKDNYDAWEPSFNYSFIPVKVNKGDNRLYFECLRGYLKVKIHRGSKGLSFINTDFTLPDLIVNEEVKTYGAVPILNSTENYYQNDPDYYIKTHTDSSVPQYFKVKNILPISVQKNPFYISLPVQKEKGKIKLHINLVSGLGEDEKILAETQTELNVVEKNEVHRETFISSLDGSVQYFGVNPPKNEIKNPALFLSLHGAGVEGIGQANVYSSKSWGYIVAPTNRRPYGYNWEHWGRIDAIEVLDIAKQKFNIDSSRIYLTGHSMGGHGTWQLGVHYPDKFAAIGPSAGWITFWSYRIKPNTDSTDTKKMLFRSTKQSDTYAFTRNLQNKGVFIIHGSADDNVPPQQSYSMIDNLKTFHKDFIYHEEQGEGHWWDKSDEPGADCVDWQPMFNMFSTRRIPIKKEVLDINFTISNPAVNSKNQWVEIINQEKQQMLSNIKITLQPLNRKFIASTSNIELFKIDASVVNGKTVTCVVDSQIIADIKLDNSKDVFLKKINGKWGVVKEYSLMDKNPLRCGNLREAFNNNVMFVFGTNGTKEEKQWAIDKAKFEAEKIWYQGNGSVLIIPDTAYDLRTHNPDGSVILFGQYFDRNVILFGNSETNKAWNILLGHSPVQVKNGEIKIKDKIYRGDNYTCLFVYPRKDSYTASVGVISGTGLKGMKHIEFANFFHPYVNFPDIVIYNSDIISSDEEGVKFTGYFGNDWSIEKGEFLIK